MIDDPRKQELVEQLQRRFRALLDVGLYQGGAAMERLVADLPESEVRLLLLVALGQQCHNIRRSASAASN